MLNIKNHSCYFIFLSSSNYHVFDLQRSFEGWGVHQLLSW